MLLRAAGVTVTIEEREPDDKTRNDEAKAQKDGHAHQGGAEDDFQEDAHEGPGEAERGV